MGVPAAYIGITYLASYPELDAPLRRVVGTILSYLPHAIEFGITYSVSHPQLKTY